MEERTGETFTQVGSFSFAAEEMRGRIENPIGAAQVPLGVAGPLLVRGEHAGGTFFVPMATTEGALVRSYERGAMALTRAGGACVRIFVDENRMTPVFLFDGVAEAAAFVRELPGRFEALRAEAEATTPPRAAVACRAPAEWRGVRNASRGPSGLPPRSG